jgi:hypothetical protein
MSIGQTGIYDLLLVDGRTLRVDGSAVTVEYEISNNDGTKEIKLSNNPNPFLVKDIPVKMVKNKVFDAYIINVLDKDCSGDKFDGVERFNAQRAEFLTAIKATYHFLDPQIHHIAIEKSSGVHDSSTSSYCLLLLGSEDQVEHDYFIENLTGGLTLKVFNSGMSETTCSSVRHGDKAEIITDSGSIFLGKQVPNRSFSYADYRPHVEAIALRLGLILD